MDISKFRSAVVKLFDGKVKCRTVPKKFPHFEATITSQDRKLIIHLACPYKGLWNALSAPGEESPFVFGAKSGHTALQQLASNLS